MNNLNKTEERVIERIRMIRNQADDISWREAHDMFWNAIQSEEFIKLVMEKREA